MVARYLENTSFGKAVLWCYLIWYLVTVVFYFDPAPRIWLNSIGISAIIGVGLILSVSHPRGRKRDFWQTARLFIMPFCVSSFSALIKDKGYLLIFSPELKIIGISIGACSIFLTLTYMIKRQRRK